MAKTITIELTSRYEENDRVVGSNLILGPAKCFASIFWVDIPIGVKTPNKTGTHAGINWFLPLKNKSWKWGF